MASSAANCEVFCGSSVLDALLISIVDFVITELDPNKSTVGMIILAEVVANSGFLTNNSAIYTVRFRLFTISLSPTLPKRPSTGGGIDISDVSGVIVSIGTLSFITLITSSPIWTVLDSNTVLGSNVTPVLPPIAFVHDIDEIKLCGA